MNKKFKDHHWLIGDRILYFFINYYGTFAWQDAEFPLKMVFYANNSHCGAYLDESDLKSFRGAWSKAIREPRWIDGVIRKFSTTRRQLVKKLKSVDFKNIDDKRLFRWYAEDLMDFYNMYQRDGNTLARALDRYGIGVLRRQLLKTGIQDIEQALTSLTVSHSESYLSLEERLFWRGIIRNTTATKRLKFMEEHLKRFAYVTRSYYDEPALRLSDLKHRLIQHPKKDWPSLALASSNALKNNKSTYILAIRDNKITANIIKSARVLRQATNLKDYIRDCFAEIFHFAAPLYQELSKRTKLSEFEIKSMTIEEVGQALFNGIKPNVAMMRQRMYGKYVTIPERGKAKVLYGRQAVKFYKKYLKVDIDDRKRIFHGRPASPGVARGQVRVVHEVAQARSVKSGEVLVVSNTNPGYVPFIKHVAAIVAEEGGVTAHAAIVSREMHIPCVIGIPRVKEILKEGERVEVDGNNGTVKKI